LSGECQATRQGGPLTARGIDPIQSPHPPGRLTAHWDWLAERFRQHLGNCDVVRLELQPVNGIAVSLRTVERAVAHLRRDVFAQMAVDWVEQHLLEALFRPGLTARPGDRAENPKKSIASPREMTSQEQRVLADPKNREALDTQRQINGFPTEFC
jgi:hypothetical protein